MSDNFEFNITPPEERDAAGGTELMMKRVMEVIPEELQDKFIIVPQRLRDEHTDSKKKKILWLHDLAEDPESAHLKDPKSRERFAKFVFPSNWAMWEFHQKLGVPYEDSVVIQNAIEPIEVHEKPKTDKKKIIYFSTPHRGLNLNCMGAMNKTNIQSFRHYMVAYKNSRASTITELCPMTRFARRYLRRTFLPIQVHTERLLV